MKNYDTKLPTPKKELHCTREARMMRLVFFICLKFLFLNYNRYELLTLPKKKLKECTFTNCCWYASHSPIVVNMLPYMGKFIYIYIYLYIILWEYNNVIFFHLTWIITSNMNLINEIHYYLKGENITLVYIWSNL